jgi:hypothetical protein
MKRLVLSIAAIVLMSGVKPAVAATVTFDFEELATGTGLTSITMTKSGITVDIYREGGATFGIADLSPFATFPASWGQRTLNPFVGGTGNTAFIANISPGVQGVSLEMGDFGADADDLILEAYSGLDGTGTLLGTATGFLPPGGSTFGFATLSTTGADIRSIRFIGGSPNFPNSVYYDNLQLTSTDMVIPEPTSLTLLGLGVIGLLGCARRKKLS